VSVGLEDIVERVGRVEKEGRSKMDDTQVCSNWEDIADNSAMLDRQLEQLRLEKANAASAETPPQEAPKIRILTRSKAERDKDKLKTDGVDTTAATESPNPIVPLDSTREENRRTQYAPPEPRITLLARPKASGSQRSNESSGSKVQQPLKTLEQREKEYKEARMRILGDVQYSDPEEDDNGLSPAEVLKQKISEVMKDEDLESSGKSEAKGPPPDTGSSTNASGSGATNQPELVKSKSRGRKNRDKSKHSIPAVEVPKEYPVPKTDSDRIVRQPRGPDGTPGFHR